MCMHVYSQVLDSMQTGHTIKSLNWIKGIVREHLTLTLKLVCSAGILMCEIPEWPPAPKYGQLE